MGTRDVRLFSQYPKEYAGKHSFEDFVNIFIKQMIVERCKKKLYLVGRSELHERYSEFCEKFRLPLASNVNIGRHLGHFGIKCDTKIGPAGAQVRFYSGISWVEGVGSKAAKKSLVKRTHLERRQRDNQRVQAHAKTWKAEETQPEEETVQETFMEIESEVLETSMETEPDVVQWTQPQTEEEAFLQNMAAIPLDDLRDYCCSQSTIAEEDINEILNESLKSVIREKEQSEVEWHGFFPIDYLQEMVDMPLDERREYCLHPAAAIKDMNQVLDGLSTCVNQEGAE